MLMSCTSHCMDSVYTTHMVWSFTISIHDACTFMYTQNNREMLNWIINIGPTVGDRDGEWAEYLSAWKAKTTEEGLLQSDSEPET